MSAENPSADNVPRETSVAAPAAWRAPGEADYEAICAAVVATERGRWFLSEYARRNRQADTVAVLAAIERIAAAVGADVGADTLPFDRAPHRGVAGLERLRAELADMASAIAHAGAEIASIAPNPANGGGIFEATAHDGVVETAERATADIVAAAEQIQEAVWTMREQGLESQLCDRLDRCATEICTACSRQQRGTQVTRKILHVLRYLDVRVQATIGLFGAPAAPKGAQPATPDAPQSPDGLVLARDAPLNPSLGEGGADQPIPHVITLPGTTPVEATPTPPSSVMGAGEATECAPAAIRSPGESESGPAAAPAAPVVASRGTLTIEGPKGSFSIIPSGTVEQPVPTEAETKPPTDPDSTAADIRAFALDLAAEDPADGIPLKVAQTSAAPTSFAPPPPSVVPETTRPPTTMAVTIENDSDELLLTAAPPLGDMPQHSVPEPAALRKTDIAEELFANVMALTDEERIALFT